MGAAFCHQSETTNSASSPSSLSSTNDSLVYLTSLDKQMIMLLWEWWQHHTQTTDSKKRIVSSHTHPNNAPCKAHPNIPLSKKPTKGNNFIKENTSLYHPKRHPNSPCLTPQRWKKNTPSQGILHNGNIHTLACSFMFSLTLLLLCTTQVQARKTRVGGDRVPQNNM